MLKENERNEINKTNETQQKNDTDAKSGNPAESDQFHLTHTGITEAIRTAFLRLDDALINEVRQLSEQNQLDSDNQGLALSGCCALVAYVLGDELFVANSGDCRAVLGANN